MAACTVAWETLPLENLCHIFTLLDGDVSALCSSSCVCKTWNDAASDARVWRRILVPAAIASKITEEQFIQLCQRSHGQMERIDITNCVHLGGSILHVFETLEALEVLEMPNIALTHLSVAYTETSAMYLVDMLKGLLEGKKLVQLRVRGCPVFVEDEANDVDNWHSNIIPELLDHVAITEADVALVNTATHGFTAEHGSRCQALAKLARSDSKTPSIAYFTVRDRESGQTLEFAKDPRFYVEDGNGPLAKAVMPLQTVGLDLTTVCCGDEYGECNILCGGAAARACGEIQCPACAGYICSVHAAEKPGCNIHGLVLCSQCMLQNDGLWCCLDCYQER